MNDSISRQVAVNKLRVEVEKVSDSLFEAEGSYSYCEMVKSISTCLDDIPTEQSEQKVGKWIKMSDADGMYYCCSECGEELYRTWSFNREYDLFPRKSSSVDKTNYCPNCGAKMED